MDVNVWDCYPQVSGKRFYLINRKYVRDNDLIGEKSICLDEAIDTMNALNEENEQLKKRIDRIDIILDDLNGAEYISRDDAIKALNKIDKVVR